MNAYGLNLFSLLFFNVTVCFWVRFILIIFLAVESGNNLIFWGVLNVTVNAYGLWWARVLDLWRPISCFW